MAKTKSKKVIVVRVGQKPVVETIDGSLESMQKLVGGYIERVNVGNGMALYCNEEGLLIGLPPNGTPYKGQQFVGDYFIINEKGGKCFFEHLADGEEVCTANFRLSPGPFGWA